MTAQSFCPNCGKARTGERFCGNCGNDFWKAAQPQATDAAPTTPPNQDQPVVRARGRNTLLLMVLIPAAIGALPARLPDPVQCLGIRDWSGSRGCLRRLD